MTCMMQQNNLLWIFALYLSLHSQLGFATVKVTNIEFIGTQDPNQILISSDGALQYEKQENSKDNQIILELQATQFANKGVARKIDTSSFDSKVSLISPYQVEGKEIVRVVIQLREKADSEVSQEGNLLKIAISGKKSGATLNTSASTSTSTAADATDGSTPQAITPPQATMEAATPPVNKDKLQEFFENRETKRFIGKPITLRVRDAEVVDVFRLIGDSSGFNIVLGEDVRGKVTLSLVDVPWDLALDTVLNTLRLGAERNNNVLRVMTLSNLAIEKQEQLRAKKAAEATAPLVTRVFPVSYANLSELQGILSKFAGSAGGDSNISGAMVQLDNRTNSIIVRDIPDNVDKMKKLIEILDTQTPQVLIEAKIIEATEQFVTQIGGTIGIGNAGTSTSKQYFASFSQGNPIDALIGSPGIFADGTAVATAGKSGSSSFGFTPALNFIPGMQRLNAIIKLGESENQLKVVASPKTVVLNKEKGSIIQGTPVLVPGSTSIPGVGTVPVSSVQSANLSLDVKPTVTNDGNILLELAISRDVPQALDDKNSGIAKRSLNTSVVVESGSTLVIGGIYTMTNSQNSSGFPFLRKIPIIGWLFGNESETTERSELFIFITPRIINEKEAGLTG